MSRTLVVSACLLLAMGCRNRCFDYGDGFGDVRVGVGTNRYIDVPDGVPVAPEPDTGDETYYNIALQTYGLPGDDLIVQLEAFVGDVLFASDRYEGVSMRCFGNDRREVGSLRLHLDPATLPPQTIVLGQQPPVDTGQVRVDSGIRWDSGWIDTGLYYVPQGDVRVRATVGREDQPVAAGEDIWFVYR